MEKVEKIKLSQIGRKVSDRVFEEIIMELYETIGQDIDKIDGNNFSEINYSRTIEDVATERKSKNDERKAKILAIMQNMEFSVDFSYYAKDGKEGVKLTSEYEYNGIQFPYENISLKNSGDILIEKIKEAKKIIGKDEDDAIGIE